MFGLIKQMLIGLSTGIVSANNHVKCVSLSDEKCTTQPSVINLHLTEYT